MKKIKKISAGKYQLGNYRIENWSDGNGSWICWVVLRGDDPNPVHTTDTKLQAVRWIGRLAADTGKGE